MNPPIAPSHGPHRDQRSLAQRLELVSPSSRAGRRSPRRRRRLGSPAPASRGTISMPSTTPRTPDPGPCEIASPSSRVPPGAPDEGSPRARRGRRHGLLHRTLQPHRSPPLGLRRAARDHRGDRGAGHRPGRHGHRGSGRPPGPCAGAGPRRSPPCRPGPHRRAGQRHLGRRGPQGRPAGVEQADLGDRSRRWSAHPPPRHRHPPVTAHALLPLVVAAPGGPLWGSPTAPASTTPTTTGSRCSTTSSRPR